MDRNIWGCPLGIVGLAVFTLAGSVRAQQPVSERQGAGGASAISSGQPSGAPARASGGFQQAKDATRAAFKLVDSNNDGQISKEEAIDAGNLTVGGFFFRADKNGDGVLSKEEITAARESLFRQRPLLRSVVERISAENTRNQGKAYATLQEIYSTIDSNGDQQLQAGEVRRMVEATVEGLFAASDSNQDGQLSPLEINAAVVGMARATADGAFRSADADHNGAVSKDEYHKALVAPADMLFVVIDANGDNQITQDEAKAALRVMASEVKRLAVSEPPNSLGNLLKSGRSPEEVAPVPAFTKPSVGANSTPAAPTAQPR